MSVTLPGTGSIVESQTTADGERQVVTVGDFKATFDYLTSIIAMLGLALESSTSRMRVSIEANSATNQSVNIAQINATAPLMGAGASGTGSLRVMNASDSPLNVIGTYQANTLVFDAMNAAWAQAIRPRIT